MVSVYVVNKLLLSLVFNSPSTQHKILHCCVAYTFLHAVAKLLRASTLASKIARGSSLTVACEVWRDFPLDMSFPARL